MGQTKSALRMLARTDESKSGQLFANKLSATQAYTDSRM